MKGRINPELDGKARAKGSDYCRRANDTVNSLYNTLVNLTTVLWWYHGNGIPLYIKMYNGTE